MSAQTGTETSNVAVGPSSSSASASGKRREMTPSASEVRRQDSAAEHAHHLKWGEIETSGFAPPEMQSDDTSDLDDHCHSVKDPAKRRRKIASDHTRELLDAEARRIHSERRYLFRRPRPLQYFRGKVLVRSNAERGSGRLELFFDLTFVGIIAVLAQSAVKTATGAGFVRYLLTYTAAYMIWHWMRETVRFEIGR